MKKTQTQKNKSGLKYAAFVILLAAFYFGFSNESSAQMILCLGNGISTFSASPSTIDYNKSTTITWGTNNLGNCTITGNGQTWSSNQFTWFFSQGNGSFDSGPLTSNTTFNLSCSFLTQGCSCFPGPCSKTINVTVNPLPVPPVIDVSIVPAQVDLHGTANLSWKVSGADSCSVTSTLGNWNLTSPTDGSQPINDITSNQTFTLTCQSKGGTVSKSASVGINTLFEAWPRQVNADPRLSGGSTLLHWISAIGGTCTITGGLSTTTGPTGVAQRLNISSFKNFQISCESGGNVSTASANVSITPRIKCMPVQ